MGAAGPVSMLCCTRAVLLQSSRAAKLSKKSLNRCRGVLGCSPLYGRLHFGHVYQLKIWALMNLLCFVCFPRFHQYIVEHEALLNT